VNPTSGAKASKVLVRGSLSLNTERLELRADPNGLTELQ